MKLAKAIELGKEAQDSLKQNKFHDHADAVKLGVEALKQVKESRFDPSTWEPKLLPGETQ